MISILDSKYKRGEHGLDSDQYHADQLAAGEECAQCGTTLYDSKPGPDRVCEHCVRFNASDKVGIHRNLRCPHCATATRVVGRSTDDGLGREWVEKMREEKHMAFLSVDCPDCDHQFQVRVEVERLFLSPALHVTGEIAGAIAPWWCEAVHRKGTSMASDNAAEDSTEEWGPAPGSFHVFRWDADLTEADETRLINAVQAVIKFGEEAKPEIVQEYKCLLSKLQLRFNLQWAARQARQAAHVVPNADGGPTVIV